MAVSANRLLDRGSSPAARDDLLLVAEHPQHAHGPLRIGFANLFEQGVQIGARSTDPENSVSSSASADARLASRSRLLV